MKNYNKTMESLDLLEPARLFKLELKDRHHQAVENYFDDLTKQSGVDIEANRVTMKNYKDAVSHSVKWAKTAGKQKSIGGLFIAFLIIGFFAAVVGLIMTIGSVVAGASVSILGIILLVVGLALGITFLVLRLTVVNKRIKSAESEKAKWDQKSFALREEGESQMARLNSMFDESVPNELLRKTAPILNFDRTFNTTKLEQLIKKYHYTEVNDKDYSILGVQSGSILGNPFVFIKDFSHKMVPHTYTGSITITYTVTVHDSNGGSHSEVRTQVLTASVNKPRPSYSSNVYLVYGNEAAPHLSFSRTMSDINKYDEAGIQKYCRKHEKDLDKLSKEAMKKGKTFTPLGNTEFDLFFGALDRDHEVEYRLLFTPLSQKAMLDLLKSKEGYGDDFSFRKRKMLNFVTSLHSQGNNIFACKEDFQGFDYDDMKNFFLDYNDNYFRSIFFDLAPLLCIPLYQQHKAKEYIYQGTINSNLSSYEHMIAANKFDDRLVAHPKTKTRVILNTTLVSKDGEADRVKITAYSHDEVQHTTIVQVHGNDGRMHAVPVVWYDYPNLVKETYMEVQDCNCTNEEFSSAHTEDFRKFCKANSSGDESNVDRGIISFLVKKDANINVNELKKFIAKK